MKLQVLEQKLTVCQVKSVAQINLSGDIWFIGKTDEEISLVCATADTPPQTVAREDGWRAFRVQGVLDFSLVGILSKLSGILAENNVGIFAVSTYNTDYILVKEHDLERSLHVLHEAGYEVTAAPQRN